MAEEKNTSNIIDRVKGLMTPANMEKAFLIAIGLYILGSEIDETMIALLPWGEILSNVLKLASMAILGIEALLHIPSYTKEQWIILIALGSISIVCTLKTNSYCPIMLMAFWMNMKNVHLEGILKAFLIFRVMTFVMVLLSCALGIIENQVYPDNCNTLGYGHPNALGISQMLILMLYMAWRDRNVRWYDIVGGVVFSVIIFAVCKSKSALIASGIILILSLLYKIFGAPLKKEAIAKIFATFPAVVCILSVLGSVLYGKVKFIEIINNIFTGRLGLGKMGIETFGITAFGQHIEWVSGDVGYNIVDNSFLLLLVNYGWIYLIVIVILLCFFGYYICKSEKWNWLMMFIVIIIHSYVEGTLVSIGRDPIIVAIGILFFCNIVSMRKVEDNNV